METAKKRILNLLVENIVSFLAKEVELANQRKKEANELLISNVDFDTL